VKGMWSRTYKQAVCMAPLQRRSASMSPFFDLKPPRLVMRVVKRRCINLSQTKVLFSTSCHGCWDVGPKPPRRECTLSIIFTFVTA
jgi:hypothetical protein